MEANRLSVANSRTFLLFLEIVSHNSSFEVACEGVYIVHMECEGLLLHF